LKGSGLHGSPRSTIALHEVIGQKGFLIESQVIK
jgi:hypothetical protein